MVVVLRGNVMAVCILMEGKANSIDSVSGESIARMCLCVYLADILDPPIAPDPPPPPP